MSKKPRATTEPDFGPAASTVDEFCSAHRIARATFYNLLKENRGPRTMKIGRRRLISREEAALWRDRMVQETEALEKENRAVQSDKAG